jgi:hypothetical protein
LPRRSDVRLHIAQDLIDHFFRIFGLVDQIVDIGANQP